MVQYNLHFTKSSNQTLPFTSK